MSNIKFTVRSIEAIKPPKSGQVDYWDSTLPGFGLRVTYRARKTWTVMYRHGRRKRRMTIGTFPSLSLADARDKAKDVLRAAAKGRDPAGERRDELAADTFGEMAEEYIRKHAMIRKRSWRKDRQILDHDLLPRFGHRKAADITRREVNDLLDGIKERGAPIQANRTLEIIRKIYNWGIGREIVAANPCQGIEKPSVEHQRERVLSDDEIRAVWGAFDLETPLMAGMFKLRLITAQRGGEISYMRKADVDWGSGWWIIPGEFTKNGLAHRVWLSEPATLILEGLLPLSDSTRWAFPSPRGDKPITVIWKAMERIRINSGVDFVAHDLRRTAASRMTGDLGISRLTVSKILNHVETGVTSIYDRHSYDGEKKQALQAWGRRLGDIIERTAAPANVLKLAAGNEAT